MPMVIVRLPKSLNLKSSSRLLFYRLFICYNQARNYRLTADLLVESKTIEEHTLQADRFRGLASDPN